MALDLCRQAFLVVALILLVVWNVDSFLLHTSPSSSRRKQCHTGWRCRAQSAEANGNYDSKGMGKVVVIQTGCGCCHGRNATKAAIRACRDAIEYNSVKIRTIIPGGYDAMKIHVQLGVPANVSEDGGDDEESLMAIDLQAVAHEFPYGELLPIVVERGGLLASNGVNLAGTGKPKEDMTLVVACVTIGYCE